MAHQSPHFTLMSKRIMLVSSGLILRSDMPMACEWQWVGLNRATCIGYTCIYSYTAHNTHHSDANPVVVVMYGHQNLFRFFRTRYLCSFFHPLWCASSPMLLSPITFEIHAVALIVPVVAMTHHHPPGNNNGEGIKWKSQQSRW